MVTCACKSAVFAFLCTSLLVVNKMFSILVVAFCLLTISRAYYDNEMNLDCEGKRYDNVTLTAYYPDYDDEDHENGYLDKKGTPLKTLQDYMDNRVNYVTMAMDESLDLGYGTRVCVPELNQHFGHRIIFEVRDSSSDLQGSGYRRADICVRTEIDSYDIAVNRRATLVFVPKI